MKFSTYLNENSDDIADQIIDEFSRIYNQVFPNGWISPRKSNFGRGSVYFAFGAVNPNSEDFRVRLSRIEHNDPMRNVIEVDYSNPEAMTIDAGGSFSISVKPREQYMAMSRHKVPARKSKAKDLKKLGADFKKKLDSLKSELVKVSDEIYEIENYKEPKKWFK